MAMQVVFNIQVVILVMKINFPRTLVNIFFWINTRKTLKIC